MPDELPLRATFDTIASLYDEVRPGYPEVIIDAIIERSQLPATGRTLEVGCGTGQITRPFAQRGYAITALELGPALAALAAEHLKLLQTFSNLQTLPEPAKTQFFQGMQAALARFGNVVTRHYETLLLVARKPAVNHQGDDQRD